MIKNKLTNILMKNYKKIYFYLRFGMFRLFRYCSASPEHCNILKNIILTSKKINYSAVPLFLCMCVLQ